MVSTRHNHSASRKAKRFSLGRYRFGFTPQRFGSGEGYLHHPHVRVQVHLGGLDRLVPEPIAQ